MPIWLLLQPFLSISIKCCSATCQNSSMNLLVICNQQILQPANSEEKKRNMVQWMRHYTIANCEDCAHFGHNINIFVKYYSTKTFFHKICGYICSRKSWRLSHTWLGFLLLAYKQPVHFSWFLNCPSIRQADGSLAKTLPSLIQFGKKITDDPFIKLHWLSIEVDRYEWLKCVSSVMNK